MRHQPASMFGPPSHLLGNRASFTMACSSTENFRRYARSQRGGSRDVSYPDLLISTLKHICDLFICDIFGGQNSLAESAFARAPVPRATRRRPSSRWEVAGIGLISERELILNQPVQNRELCLSGLCFVIGSLFLCL